MRTALETAARSDGQTVQTLGPLIHNPQALKRLSQRGVTEAQEVAELAGGAVIIRAHGVPAEDLRRLIELRRARGLRICNATCPAVAHVQSLIRRQASKGGTVIILGQPTHAEVVAHRSFATAGCHIIQTLEEAEAIPTAVLPGSLLVAQTTFSVADFEAITASLRGRYPSLPVRNTICPDTFLRQKEAEDLASAVPAIVVVGGHSSNNTRHLVETARLQGKPVQWIESAEDLDLPALEGAATVGVLAGASTPSWTVDEVVEVLEQAGHPSLLRLAERAIRTVDIPLALGLGAAGFLMHRLLGWSTTWIGPVLPASFHIAMRALGPYVDAAGLDAQGLVQGKFLDLHRQGILGMGRVAALVALLSAARLGPVAAAGLCILATLALAYPARRLPARILTLPAVEDLGPALTIPALILGLPLLQGYRAGGQALFSGFVGLFSLGICIQALRHLRVFEENRIVGREVLPVAIGSRATRWVAIVMGTVGAAAFLWMGILVLS